jgi:hypothetical protein
MKLVLIIQFITAALASAQPGILPPRIGFVYGATHSIRPMFGIAANFIAGDPIAADVVSSAFSGSFGLLKTEDTVIVMDASGQTIVTLDAPSGSALFGFSRDGAPALAFFPSKKLLLQWNGTAFDPVTFETPDPVLSISSRDPGFADLIVQRDDTLWEVRIQLAGGLTLRQAALVGVRAPALLLASGDLIYRDSGGVVIRRPGQSEVQIPADLPGQFQFRQMSSEWIQINDIAVRITPSRECIFSLPEVEQ